MSVHRRASALAGLAAVLAGALALGTGCAPRRPARWNVVVLLVDTLRADRLELYGYSRATAPHLAELASGGVLFRDARAQAGCTYPSVNSILTSRWPQRFINDQDRWGMAIPADAPTLATLLAGAGYTTAAVSSSIIVRATPSKINLQGGFGRGFQSFDETCLGRSAACVNDRAYGLLDRLPEPFLLYLHYTDPHQPYHPPAWHERRFARDESRKRWVRIGDPLPIFRRLYDHDLSVEFDDSDVRHLSDLYDEEIAFFDDRLGELVARLRQGGLLDRTVVVLLADHGEELYDHHDFGHCRDMAWETLLRTPLVLRYPGGPAGAARDGMALNLDLVPTLLDLLHVPYDPAAFDGRSLRPLVERDRAVEPFTFAAQGENRVASDGRYKLWLDLAGGPPRAYDLGSDPGETAVAAHPDPGELQRLRAALGTWLERQEGGKNAANLRHAHETEAALRALGYL